MIEACFGGVIRIMSLRDAYSCLGEPDLSYAALAAIEAWPIAPSSTSRVPGPISAPTIISTPPSDSPLAWAALVWLSVLGIVLFGAMVPVERLVMPWAPQGRH